MQDNQERLERLQQAAKLQRRKERWLRTRMWFAAFVSAFTGDRGSIPQNIGNNVLITNNTYTTKNSLSAVVLVREMSQDTPLAWTSDLQNAVKSVVSDVQIDFTFKMKRYPVDTKSASMLSRIRSWKLTLENPFSTELAKQRAARCLYTIDIVQSGDKLFKSVTYVTVRARNGSALAKATERATDYLNGIGTAYKIIKSNLRSHMEFLLTMSDRRSPKVKDFQPLVLSQQTLAESLPITQGMNDTTGTFMGIDTFSQTPYLINFRKSAGAKNIYISAASGSGKTILAQNWFMDMSSDGFNMCIMDIKGTEFTAFTHARGGIVLDLGPRSTKYVNTFKLDCTEAGENFRVYYGTRLGLSKAKMLTLADLPSELTARGDALLEEFLRSVYLEKGITPDNPNTWARSGNITPYAVFDALSGYLSPAICTRYSDVADRLYTKLAVYMSKNGSSSHVFSESLDYKAILDAPVLTFSFGLIGGMSDYDAALFKARVLDMSLINDEYVACKAKKGEWTGKVLEESQIAPDYLIDLYSKDFTIRRSQNQVTILLGNSVSALANNPHAKGILENINILVLGNLPYDSREYLTRQYGLEDYAEMLDDIRQPRPDNDHAFLLINRLQAKSTVAKLKAFIPGNVVNGRLYKQVNTHL